VDCGGAVGVLACGCGAAEAADDSGQELRRSFGEAWRLERRKRSRMGCVSARVSPWGAQGCASNRRRRHGEQKLLLASRRVRGARGDGGATWRGEERAGAGRVSGERGAGGHVALRRAARGQLGLGKRLAKAAVSRARGRAGGTGGRRRRTGLEFSKNAGTPL
jgi:hypothetical protein